jgi:phospholipid/cholesterol/gamma-HCH transport system permease protein
MSETRNDRGRIGKTSEEAWASARLEGELLVVSLGGPWVTKHIGRKQARLAEIGARGAQRARIDLSALAALDTAGAWLIHRATKSLAEQGVAAELQGADAAAASLIETARRFDIPYPPEPAPGNAILVLVARVGRATIEIARQAVSLVNYLGLTVVVLLRLLARPWRVRGTALVSHMEQSGLNALPIVGLISFLIGVVLAYQGADQLAKFGAQIFTANLVGVGVLREMGILLTAIIVAGRSGSAYTAQIGTMNVNEEIDAMRTMGLDPMELLVLPRVVALVIVLPLLTFYADILGLLGGAVMATAVLDISFFQFARQINNSVSLWSFWVGMIKAPVFAFIIATVGTYEGFNVTRSAESVGRQTTRAVVEAVFLVIVLDALFSILFSILGI